MRKRIYIIIVLLFLVLVIIKILNHYKKEYVLNYNDFIVEGDMIIKYKASGNVVIPEVINGVKITRIDEYAFYDLEIDSVVIPDSIVSIGDYAFANNNLKVLKIPDSVLEIGEGAFMNNSLVGLDLPTNIFLGNACFNNNLLEEDDAFFYSLENKKELISYGGKIKGHVVVNDGVEVIGKKAFLGTEIISISLPLSVSVIKEEAFRGNNLVDIYLSNNISQIASDVFLDNNYLVNVSIDNKENSILNFPWGLEDSNVNWLKK